MTYAELKKLSDEELVRLSRAEIDSIQYNEDDPTPPHGMPRPLDSDAL